MNIFVTGGTGFIGNAIVQCLSKNANNKIFVLGTNNELKLPVNCFYYDYKNFNVNNFLIKNKIDILYHQAANNNTQDKNKKQMLFDNYYYFCDFFDKFYENGCKKYIYASSCAVYGNSKSPYVENSTELNPLTYYGLSKKLFDQFAMNFYSDASVVGLRYSNVYGFNESHKSHRASMIYQMINNLKKNKNQKLFKDGSQSRDWVFIDDVVLANLLALNYSGTAIFNCGSGISTSFLEIFNFLKEELNSNSEIEFISNDIESTYQNFTCCNIDLIKSALGFQPKFSIWNGMKKVISNLI